MAPLNADYQRKEVLQAVVIGEDFSNQFHPITNDVHKLLLPLVNTPLVDYNLDWLHRNAVEEVFIYCKATPFSEEIKRHCKSVVERRHWNNMAVRVIASDDIRSVGGAIRDLYAKSLILGDFLLIRGDTVTNLSIRKLMDVHKANKKMDCKAVMTCVLLPMDVPCEADLMDPSASEDVALQKRRSFTSLRVTTMASMTGKLVSYSRGRRGATASFLAGLGSDSRSDYFISPDLADPCMSVCSVEVLGLFADNFDCMTTDSLVKSLLQPDDLNDCSVYQHIALQGSATNVTTWKDYETSSLLMIERMYTPLVPEVSYTSGRRRYLHDSIRQHYWAHSSDKGYSTHHEQQCLRVQHNNIGVQVVLGEGVDVSVSARLRSCVLGNHCAVGDNATLVRVFLGDHCNIGAGCKATQCYLGPNVTLLPNTTLKPGCVVAGGVTLGPNATLDRASLVTTRAHWDSIDDFERDGEIVELSPSAVLLPRNQSNTLTSSESGLHATTDGQHLPIWGLREDDFIFVDDQDASTTDEDEIDGAMADYEGDVLDEDEQKELDFTREVLDSLCNGIKGRTEVSKVVLEINASRYAYNIPLETMQLIVFKNVLLCFEHLQGVDEEDVTRWPAWPSIKKGLSHYQELLQRYFKTAPDYLNTLEWLVDEEDRVLSSCVKLLFELTQELMLVEDTGVLLWFAKGGKHPQSPSKAFVKLKEKVSGFLTWLETAEEESEED
ncbi:Hexapeptide repeat [Trinorchestia longiramus]|nr:Hexapeptide repeat [Trinorchestia longiramus]